MKKPIGKFMCGNCDFMWLVFVISQREIDEREQRDTCPDCRQKCMKYKPILDL